MLARDEPDRVASLGIRFDRATGRMRNGGVGDTLAPPLETPWRQTDAVNGAVMLVTREVFDRIGLLDEEYFFGFEEIDFCVRARDAGFAVGVDSRAVAYHRGGATLEAGSARRFYFAARNHLRLAGARRPAGRRARPRDPFRLGRRAQRRPRIDRAWRPPCRPAGRDRPRRARLPRGQVRTRRQLRSVPRGVMLCAGRLRVPVTRRASHTTAAAIHAASRAR